MSGCRELAAVIGVQDCCDSCHVDDEDFDMPLAGREYLGVEYRLCCAMLRELEAVRGAGDPRGATE